MQHGNAVYHQPWQRRPAAGGRRRPGTAGGVAAQAPIQDSGTRPPPAAPAARGRCARAQPTPTWSWSPTAGGRHPGARLQPWPGGPRATLPAILGPI